MSFDQNKHYLFFEITGKCPILTEINRTLKAQDEAKEKAEILAKEFHKDAAPLILRRWAFEMVGIFIEADEQLKLKGWRHRKQWGMNHFVPALNTKAGKQAAYAMLQLKVPNNSDRLQELVAAAFGENALNGKFVDSDAGRESYLLDWKWGSYPDGKGGFIRVLRVMRRPESEKAKTPRGLKKVKYSRIVELSEIEEEAEATA